MWVEDQHSVYRTPQPRPPPACGSHRSSGRHALQGRRRVATPAVLIPDVSQLLSTPYQLTPAPPPAPAHQRDGFREALAPLYASDGGGAHGSGLDITRGAMVSRATMATAAGADSG